MVINVIEKIKPSLFYTHLNVLKKYENYMLGYLQNVRGFIYDKLGIKTVLDEAINQRTCFFFNQIVNT